MKNMFSQIEIQSFNGITNGFSPSRKYTGKRPGVSSLGPFCTNRLWSWAESYRLNVYWCVYNAFVNFVYVFVNMDVLTPCRVSLCFTGSCFKFRLAQKFSNIKIYPKRIKRKVYYQIHSSPNKGTFHNNQFFDRENISQEQSAISRKKLNIASNEDIMFISMFISNTSSDYFSRKIFLSVFVNFFAIRQRAENYFWCSYLPLANY